MKAHLTITGLGAMPGTMKLERYAVVNGHSWQSTMALEGDVFVVLFRDANKRFRLTLVRDNVRVVDVDLDPKTALELGSSLVGSFTPDEVRDTTDRASVGSETTGFGAVAHSALHHRYKDCRLLDLGDSIDPDEEECGVLVSCPACREALGLPKLPAGWREGLVESGERHATRTDLCARFLVVDVNLDVCGVCGRSLGEHLTDP